MNPSRPEGPHDQSVQSFCRFCTGFCPLEVDLIEGRPVAARGDPTNPLYDGFFCLKGRDFGTLHTHPDRFLHSQRKRSDGSYEAISSATAMDEVADRVAAILGQSGPAAVALYAGTVFYQNASTAALATAFMNAIRSPMRFSSGTLDQPGKQIAAALHGSWLAGTAPVSTSDSWMIVGSNPLVAISGPQSNPAKVFRDAVERGLELVVIDPRRTETARLAKIHLQPRPGFDAEILAAMIREILESDLLDREFAERHLRGIDELRSAVKPFSAARVAAHADVSAADIVEAARIFARARRGVVQVGTGPNMARTGNLTEYLALCLMSLTGHWRRVGDPVENPPVLSPARSFRAAASPPGPAFDLGIDLRVRDFSLAACGLPTSALSDEILLPGPGQIKALFVVGGNPLTAWPDPERARRALESLDLLVVLDPKPTPTARLADYVIAPKLGLEIPDTTLSTESLQAVAPGFGFPLPHAQYAPAVAAPPVGSELIEDWEFFYGLGQRLGLALRVQTALFPIPGVRPVRTALDMERAPSSDELLDMLTADARIPLSVVRAERGPGLFPGDPVRVEAARGDEGAVRLEVGDATMRAELCGLAEALESEPGASRSTPVDGYRLIPRRMAHAFNSMGTDHPVLRKRYGTNPAFLNPHDLEALGVERGDPLRIASAHGEIEVIAWPDPGLRRGLVSISHAWGGEPEAVDDPMKHGAHVGRLISVEQDFDPYSGIPWMSGFPVSVCAAVAGAAGSPRRIAPGDEK